MESGDASELSCFPVGSPLQDAFKIWQATDHVPELPVMIALPRVTDSSLASGTGELFLFLSCAWQQASQEQDADEKWYQSELFLKRALDFNPDIAFETSVQNWDGLCRRLLSMPLKEALQSPHTVGTQLFQEGRRSALTFLQENATLVTPFRPDNISSALYFLRDKYQSRSQKKGELSFSIHKTLFYAEALCLKETGLPLFCESPVRWPAGPVYTTARSEFLSLAQGRVPMRLPFEKRPDAATQKYLDKALASLCHLTARELVTYTHMERPWLETEASASMSPLLMAEWASSSPRVRMIEQGFRLPKIDVPSEVEQAMQIFDA
eukprot:m.98873 g.98873  ORF g.98873 m.98873 type:complete len:323 (-) comp8704_c0_seq2:345-1313(-)